MNTPDIELEPEFVRNVQDAVALWAKSHPDPDKPHFRPLGQGKEYTPREFCQAIRRRTRFGKEALQVYSNILNSPEKRDRDYIFEFITGKPAPVLTGISRRS